MSLYGKDDSNTNKTKAGRGVAASSQAKEIIFVDNTEAAIEANKERGLNAPGWWSYYSYTDCEGNTRHKAEHLVTIADPEANAQESQSDDAYAADSVVTITISGQPSNQTTRTPAGAILTTTHAGTAAAGTGSYTINSSTAGIVVTNVSGGSAPAATGYEFTVARSGGTYTVTVVTGGSGFAATDTILVKGSTLGGVDTTNDLTITVATVATAAATFSVTASASAGSLVYQWQTQTATGTRWTNVTGATSASLALTSLTTADTGKKYRCKITTTSGAPESTTNTATLTVTAA